MNVSIFITGSNSKVLSCDLATHLTGRYITIKIMPFTFSEYLELQESQGIKKNREEAFEEYEELIKLIETLKIDKSQFWILSSSALVLRGIYPDAGDLDIAVTQEGLDELKKSYNLIRKENGWFIVNENVECVLDTMEDWKVEKVGDYYLEDIEKYYDFLIHSNREKDKLRIPIVKKYIDQRKHTGDER